MSANTSNTANTAIVNENYNEFYSAMILGNYPANPTNGPSGTGPAAYPAAFNEIMFTAPPSSVAIFWISWDANQIVDGAPSFNSDLTGETYAAFPVLHFGGITADPAYLTANGTPYFGDLNAMNGEAIMGTFTDGLFDAGTPPQMFPYFPASAFADPLDAGTITPEGLTYVGMAVVGASGAAQDTGNDGLLQIFQCQFDNFMLPMQRTQYRGTYNGSNFYYPNEIVAETNGANTGTFIQATPVAIQGIDPYVNLSNAPLTDGTNWISFQNLWMPLGGAGNGGGQDYQGTVVTEGHNTVICNTTSGVQIVNYLVLTGGGSNYTSVPTVSFTGGGGSGASAVATINTTSNTVNGLILETGGSGWTSAPNVAITGGGGTGATGNANIGSGFTMAKPPELRGFVTTTNDSQGSLQKILPPYGTGNFVYACTPIGGTNVTNVILEDINASSRVLATKLNTCENISGSLTQKSRYFDCSTYF
jgi:hypothetical protein